MLRGEVVLPQATDLEGALLIVRLRDAAMSDAPAPVLAMSRQMVSGRGVRRVPFRLRLTRDWPPGARPAFEAELRVRAGGALAPGDWLTVCHLPYRHGEHSGIEIPVERIS